MLNPVYASTTYVAGTGTDVVGAIEAIADIGLDGIELGSTHAPREWPEMSAEIRRRWPGSLVTHNYFPPAQPDIILNLASSDDALRAASLDHMLYCLRCSAEVGASIYTVHPGFVADALSQSKPGEAAYDFRFSDVRSQRDVAMTRMFAALERLAAEARKLGVTLAVETEGSMTTPGVLLLETPEEFDQLFERLDGAVGLNLNLAHSFLASRQYKFDLDEFIARFSNRIVASELSHNDGHHDQHRPIGEGSWILGWLPRLPAGIPLILEFRDATPAALAESMRLVRGQ